MANHVRIYIAIGVLAYSSASLSAAWPASAYGINQFNRYLGTGWSDGYHACRPLPRGLGADGPPAPAWLRQRWAAPPNHWAMQPGGAPEAAPFFAPEPAPGAAPISRQPSVGSRRPPVPPSILEEIRRYRAEEETEDNWLDDRPDPAGNGDAEAMSPGDEANVLPSPQAENRPAADETDLTQRGSASPRPAAGHGLMPPAKRPRALVREPGGPRRLIRESDLIPRDTAAGPAAPPARGPGVAPRRVADPLAWIVEPSDDAPPPSSHR